MRRLLTTTTAVLALAAPMLLSGPASAAPAQVTIKPGTLKRGPDEVGPHLHGTTIHDGTVRVKLKVGRVRMLGKWNTAYVVVTGNRQWGNTKLVRVSKSGKTRLLVAGIDPFNAQLDADGNQVAYSYGDSTQKPTIGVYDLVQKKETDSRSFASLPTLLDFDLSRVIASFWDFRIKTVTWDTVTDTVARVNRKQSNYASIANDLIGFFNKDPQAGGCQVLAHLTNQADRLWRSCKERIQDVSPNGRRLATIPLLSDGIGPADIMVRKAGGRALAHYSIDGWFGRIAWETDTRLLMESNGAVKAALVRCRIDVCNRASRLTPTPQL